MDGTINERDRVMALALQVYEDSLCPSCGLPHSVTRGDHNVGRVEWRDDAICHGCEGLEELRSDKNRVTWPGQKLYPLVSHDSDQPQ